MISESDPYYKDTFLKGCEAGHEEFPHPVCKIRVLRSDLWPGRRTHIFVIFYVYIAYQAVSVNSGKCGNK